MSIGTRLAWLNNGYETMRAERNLWHQRQYDSRSLPGKPGSEMPEFPRPTHAEYVATTEPDAVSSDLRRGVLRLSAVAAAAALVVGLLADCEGQAFPDNSGAVEPSVSVPLEQAP